MSLVCGFRAERGKARADTAHAASVSGGVGEREPTEAAETARC